MPSMRFVPPLLCLALAAFSGSLASGQTPAETFPPVANVKQLMLDLIHPSSNDILLAIFRGGPKDEKDWAVIRRSAVALAESGNMLMQRGRARDQGEWMKDAKLLVDVGNAAYKAAQAKDARRAGIARRGDGRILHHVPQTISAERVSPRKEARNELFAQEFPESRRIGCRAHHRWAANS